MESSESTNTPSKPRKSYRDKFHLLDKWETPLYFKLCEAFPRFYVFCQVSVLQMLYIGNTKRDKDAFQKFNEIGRMSVDFLVCKRNEENIDIVAAFELNGASHQKEERKRSDDKKRLALTEAGIPLVVYEVGSIPDIATIRNNMAYAILARKKYEEERNERFDKGKR